MTLRPRTGFHRPGCDVLSSRCSTVPIGRSGRPSRSNSGAKCGFVANVTAWPRSRSARATATNGCTSPSLPTVTTSILMERRPSNPQPSLSEAEHERRKWERVDHTPSKGRGLKRHSGGAGARVPAPILNALLVYSDRPDTWKPELRSGWRSADLASIRSQPSSPVLDRPDGARKPCALSFTLTCASARRPWALPACSAASNSPALAVPLGRAGHGSRFQSFPVPAQ